MNGVRRLLTMGMALSLALYALPVRAGQLMNKTGGDGTDCPVTVVLALSGGGMKGYAHVGVLEVLEQHHIHVAGIVGTSMGAIIGGLYAVGYSANALAHIVETTNLGDLIIAPKGQSLSRVASAPENNDGIRPEVYFDKKWKTVGPVGIFSGGQVMEFLVSKTKHVTTTDFFKLPIPFAAVATDLYTGQKVVLRHGNLASAIRASMSLPGIFDPWKIGNHLLVDGGLVSNMPVKTARELFPGYPVVAVDLTSALLKDGEIRNTTDVLSQVTTILTQQNVTAEAKLADVLIRPNVKEYPLLGRTDAAAIIASGRRAALKVLPEILALPRRPLPRRVTAPSPEPLVAGVVVKGLAPALAERFERQYEDRWKGRPLRTDALVTATEKMLERRDIRSVNYNLLPQTLDDSSVLVELDVNRYPAHRVMFGANASTLTNRGWLTVRTENNDVFRPGDQLETTTYLADDWGLLANYALADPSENPWEYRLWASRFTMKPLPIDGRDGVGDFQRWYRYGLAAVKRFDVGRDAELEAGVKLDMFRRSGADYGQTMSSGWHNESYLAPFVDFRWNWQNDVNDPTLGLSFALGLEWPLSADALLIRATGRGTAVIDRANHVELLGGYTHGAITESPLFAAYLGAQEEMLSLSAHPIAGQSFLWGRLMLIHTMKQTFLGDIDLELFGGSANVWDNDGRSLAEPWELGAALSSLGRLFSARVYALYSDRDEWKFGVSLGFFDRRPFLPF